MSAPLVFVVPGTPRPKGRPRTVRVKASGKVTTFTPRATRSYETGVRLYAVQALARAKWPKRDPDDRFAVELTAFLPDWRRLDLDNIAKSVLDGMIGAVYGDDSQVSRMHLERVLGDPNPRLEVRVRLVVERTWPEPARKDADWHLSKDEEHF